MSRRAPASRPPLRSQGKWLPTGHLDSTYFPSYKCQEHRKPYVDLVTLGKSLHLLQSLYLEKKGVQLQGPQGTTVSILQYHFEFPRKFNFLWRPWVFSTNKICWKSLLLDRAQTSVPALPPISCLTPGMFHLLICELEMTLPTSQTAMWGSEQSKNVSSIR